MERGRTNPEMSICDGEMDWKKELTLFHNLLDDEATSSFLFEFAVSLLPEFDAMSGAADDDAREPTLTPCPSSVMTSPPDRQKIHSIHNVPKRITNEKKLRNISGEMTSNPSWNSSAELLRIWGMMNWRAKMASPAYWRGPPSELQMRIIISVLNKYYSSYILRDCSLLPEKRPLGLDDFR